MQQLYSNDEIREASIVSESIQVLAESVLSKSEIEIASTLSRMLLLTEQTRKKAQIQILKLCPKRPKRPLYYAVGDLQGLPEEARNSMKYFGDYLDMLVKSWAHIVTHDARSLKRPLGSNLEAIDQNLNQAPDWVDLLECFNDAIYVPAKHDFELPDDRSIHRFTSTEALLTASITVHLAEMVSKEHALLLTDGVETGRLSVSLAIVDPLARVLLIKPNGMQTAFDVPHCKVSKRTELPELAAKLSEELTSKRARIIRCLGRFERLDEPGTLDEVALVMSSSYLPDNLVKPDAVWVPTNDIHYSNMKSPSHDELKCFL